MSSFDGGDHDDQEHRRSLEKHLSVLVRNGVIKQWYDRKITAGSTWEAKILENLESADIVVFLVTKNWLSSNSCIYEWNKAKEFSLVQPVKKLIPIIASECAWLDFDDMSSLLALPLDGKPVTQWRPMDSAWSSVYDGIKEAAEEVKKNFQLKPSFVTQIQRVEFCSASTQEILLEDVFVFPYLTSYADGEDGIEIEIDDLDDLISVSKQFVVGEIQSGKTKLGSWIVLCLNKLKIPCLYVDFSEVGGKKDKRKILQDNFSMQLTGDFDMWLQQDKKYIVFDNLDKENKCIDLIKFAEENFSNVIVFSGNDTYKSYYVDDDRFTGYRYVNIKPFCHERQEELIKKWISVKSKSDDVDLNLVDSLEKNINSIIIDNKVLPRFPFFILSILQTYESFMPENLKITAYGHCYHALILARLIKSGISQEDSALESAFTFCSSLAYQIFQSGSGLCLNEADFVVFKNGFKADYIIKESVFNRLFSEYGVLELKAGLVSFKIQYSYYFFLGKYLTENYLDNKDKISSMVESSFARHNSLTLIFTIHHANDIAIIDEILAHTMCAVDGSDPAQLTRDETLIFNGLLENVIPEKLAGGHGIESERSKERRVRTQRESGADSKEDDIASLAEKNELFNQVFQCNKNIEILSQILKNKIGSLKKSKIYEIVETICDAGLRLASVALLNPQEIETSAKFVYDQYKESNDYDSSKTDSYHLNEIKK